MTDHAGITRVPVLTASEARALDVATIAVTGDSYRLMRRAAQVAAEWLQRLPAREAAVYIGTGNNGGDGWLIAAALRAQGWLVRVHSIGDPRTRDALRARVDAMHGGAFEPPDGTEPVLIDALLGTGAVGVPRGATAVAIDTMRSACATASEAGTSPLVIAVDVPSCLDASDGTDYGAVPADHTLTFGGVKRGLLLRRDIAGAISVLDIGLVAPGHHTLPQLVTADAVAGWLPALGANIYKGHRKRIAIVGGGAGMAGAVILAARAAHLSGAGMIRADVADVSVPALQSAVPFATASGWRDHDFSAIDTDWPDLLVIGPGLDGGRTPDSVGATALRGAIVGLLRRFAGPVVLDAGALTAFTAHSELLGDALAGRPSVITPHVGEFTRLTGGALRAQPSDAANEPDRFAAPAALASALGTTVLLKGVPTVVSSGADQCWVSAAGTPALAMGGTGDVLAGIVGTLLAQGLSPAHSAAAAAWVHGTAAERATVAHGGWRGVSMESLLHELSQVWPRPSVSHSTTLAELPAVSAR